VNDETQTAQQRFEALGAGVSARVIKYLRGDDWRHGAPMGQGEG